MKVGIVTTWFERGAAYVSKQFEDVLSNEHEVFIYARSGEKYAIDDPKWNKPNVTWGLKRTATFATTLIAKHDFIKWLAKNQIDIVLFNEQQWWYPILWCNELKIPTVCYVDYYTANTIPLFSAYSALICNTKRHYSVFNWHPNSFYIPWGTDCSIYKPTDNISKLVNNDIVTFFHSCGMDPYRKGTDLLLQAAEKVTENYKLIIHTQIDLMSFFNNDIDEIIIRLIKTGKLEIINKTLSAPGLFHLGDVYVYPSRLEGIGLTIAEAEACGLIPLVTNNGPMNEFVNDQFGFLIDVSKYYAREDGYYWPECTPDIISLTNHMIKICKGKEEIISFKAANYKFANENLNWEKNSQQIVNIIDQIKFTPLEEDIKNKIIKYENTSFRKINSTYLRYYWLLSFISKIVRKYLS